MADRGSRSGPAVRVVGVVTGAVLLVTVLFAWAAAQGHGQVFAGDGGDRLAVSEAPQSSPVADQAQTADPQQSREDDVPTHDLSWIGVLVQVVLLALIVALVARLGWLAWRRMRERRRPGQGPVADFELVSAPESVARDVVTGAQDQFDLLLSGAPRNGIVAAWERFEQLAARHGLARARAETSSELTLRVLDLVDADRGAVQRLAELFREARFSEHQITEDHRWRAAEALSQIHDSVTPLGSRPGV